MIAAAPKERTTHAQRVKANSERPVASSGKEFAESLLSEFKAIVPDCEADAHKWRMFSEIIMHNAFDMAGNRYIRSPDGSRFSSFDSVFEGLNKKEAEEFEKFGKEQWLDFVLPLLDQSKYLDASDLPIKNPAELREKMSRIWDQIKAEGFHASHLNEHEFHFKDEEAREAYTAKFADSEKLFHQVLDILPAYTAGYVQTPHPTEVLSREAINAEQALHTELEHNLKLFNGQMHLDQRAQVENVLGKMKTLFDEIKPVLKPVDIDNEMLRSVQFSEQMFDSVPITAQAVIDSAKRHEVMTDPKGERRLNPEELLGFNFLIQPQTWSPGDRDSKTLMTCEKLQAGIQMNKKAMQLHYVKKLAALIADPETPELAGNQNELHVKDNLRQIMWNVMQDVSITDMGASLKESNLPPEAQAEIEKLQNARREMAAALPRDIEYDALERPFHEIVTALKGHGTFEPVKTGKLASHPALDVSESRYLSGIDFISDLEAMRGSPDGVNPPHYATHVLPDGHECNFSKLDALIMQANNFGKSALRSQIRENSEMHAEVMETTLKLLDEKGVKIPGYDPANPKTAHDMKVIKAAIATLMAPGNEELSNKIHQILTDEIAKIAPDIQRLRAGKPVANADTPEFKEQYKFYETLLGMKIATDNPEAITHYLIAECPGAEQILETFFLLKAVESNDTRRLIIDKNGHTLPKVELVPLFEYRKDVERIPQILADAYSDPYFTAHHNGLSDSEHPAIAIAKKQGGLPNEIQTLDTLGMGSSFVDVSPKAMGYDRLTVAQVKAMYHMEIKPGDEKREIKAMKTVMMAGSDITKSSGCAGAGLVLHAFMETRKQLLEQDPPVLLLDYTGCGSGIHRSHPVGSSMQTTQGRGMRDSDSNIAQKTLINLGRFILKKLGFDKEQPQSIDPSNKAEKLILAQLNLGNLHGLPIDEETWQSQTKNRLLAQMKCYEGIYTDPAFSAYMGFTADPFVKPTSYAARAAARTRGTEDKGFPPLVDVSNLRAIGYGASLNAAGSCATYFYGAGEFLGLDDNKKIPEDQKKELVQLYLQDPVAQDTINRATYGVVMANMDSAWKYMDCTRKVSEDGNVIITDGKGQSLSTADLAKSNAAVEAATAKIANKEVLSLDEKRLLAMYEMARIDQQYERAKHGLLQLQQLARRECGAPQRTPQEAQKLTAALGDTIDNEQRQLLAELPQTLREQIIESRKNVDPGRKHLSELFNDVVNGRQEMPKRDDKNPDPNFNKVYFPMGAVFECFENIPRAYTRVRWSIAHEQQMQQARSTA